MRIPCVCKAGGHSFTAHEMVQIIAAFQRGELHRTTYDRGIKLGIFPVCLTQADFEAGITDHFTGPCDVLLEDGTACKGPRGHSSGRHGVKPRKQDTTTILQYA